MAEDDATTWRGFDDTVNMTAAELEEWLATRGNNESTGSRQAGGS